MVDGISGTTTQVSAAKTQPEVVCTHYTFSDWYALTGEISNIYGFWDCDFV